MSNKLPEGKDSLLELIKKLWLPVASFLGAVTLAYNFYKIWSGDQATVTYITAGAGLLVLVIALGWVGFKTRTVEVDLILLGEHQTTAKRSIIQPAYGSKYQRMARGTLSIVLIGMIWSGYSLIQRRQAELANQELETIRQSQATQARATQSALATLQAGETQQALATQSVQATLQAQEELQKKLTVVIATFEGPEEAYGLRNEIVESLNSAFAQDEEVKIITVDDVVSPDQGSSYARNLGEQYFADLVMWGWYRPTEDPNITIHIENLSPTQIDILPESDTYEPNATLAQLQSFEIQRQLGSETSTLVSFLIGTLKLEARDYQAAIDRFEQVRWHSNISTFINQADLFFNLGYSHHELGNYESAIRDYDRVIEINPQFAIAYNNRGGIYFNAGDYERAIQDYDKVIELDPQFAFGYYNRGKSYRRLGEHQRAILDFDRFIEMRPREANAYISRGNSYSDLGDVQRAIQDYDQAIVLDPENETAFYNRGNKYRSLGEDERAIQDYDKAIALDPGYTKAYYNRGNAYRGLGDNERAIQDYDKAVALDPEHLSAYINRGNAYYDLEKYERAIQDYDKAIALNSRFALAYNNRGVAYFNLDQIGRSIEDYNKAIELDPGYASPYKNRGKALQKLGKTAEAEADFKKYEELTGEKP